MLRSVQEN
jgi:hypothetical protein